MIAIGHSWWSLVLRGIAAILFGLAAFFWPGLTLVVLALLFGAYALVDGAFAIAHALGVRERLDRWWALLLEGVAGVLFGLLALFWPGITVLVLLYLIAAWAIVTGVLEIATAVRLREEISNEWLLALAGVASLAFGLLLVAFPGAGALAVAWIIGAYAIIFGVLLIALGFRLRQPAPA